MTTKDYLTNKMIDAYQQILGEGTKRERRLALKRLVEIAQRCRNDELSSRAHKLVANHKEP